MRTRHARASTTVRPTHRRTRIGRGPGKAVHSSPGLLTSVSVVRPPGHAGNRDLMTIQPGGGLMSGQLAMVPPLDDGPVHRSIVAVDVEGSTKRTNPAKGKLRRILYDLLERALRTAGIGPRHLEELADRGDGVLILIRPYDDVPKTVLLGRLIPALTTLLAEHNAAVAEPELRMRLRAVVHAGEVHDDGMGILRRRHRRRVPAARSADGEARAAGCSGGTAGARGLGRDLGRDRPARIRRRQPLPAARPGQGGRAAAARPGAPARPGPLRPVGSGPQGPDPDWRRLAGRRFAGRARRPGDTAGWFNGREGPRSGRG